jgi:hypothetical protein
MKEISQSTISPSQSPFKPSKDKEEEEITQKHVITDDICQV